MSRLILFCKIGRSGIIRALPLHYINYCIVNTIDLARYLMISRRDRIIEHVIFAELNLELGANHECCHFDSI